MRDQSFVEHHLREALRGAAAEADGDEELSRRLHAETKLRLVGMSDEELWELARLTSFPPERPAELVYKGIKQAIEELKATAGEWVNDLAERPTPDKEGKDGILIIEDEPILRGNLTSALTEAGFAVVDVPDYPEALLKLDEFKPDMVIADEVLPSGDGIEACSQLPSTLGIPVILLGKDSSGEAQMRAVEAGADLYIRKPFSYLELVARVKAILRRYKRRGLTIHELTEQE